MEIMKTLCLIVACMFTNVVADTFNSPAKLLETLVLTTDNLKDAFNGLDVKRDKLITMDDINELFYHSEAEFAKSKFITMLDVKPDHKIQTDELNVFLKKKAVTNAVWECTYIHSESLREYCFADQIVTYAYLVIDHSTGEKLFRDIEDPNDTDDEISIEEVKKLVALNPKFSPEEQVNFLVEIGGDDKRITFGEFLAYVVQEDLQDDFRRCRNKLEGCIATYDLKCMTKELIDYTMNYLTELDIATVFDEFDQNHDKQIVKKDLLEAKLCSEPVAERFVKLMDKSGKGEKVSYGEFRTYLKTHTVKIHLERDCAQKETLQSQEIGCYKEKIINLAIENHTPIWLKLPDLDMLFTFEDLDVNNNGFIKTEEDLVDGKQWELDIATKMVKEMDGRDKNNGVCLEEFYEYVGEPHMVYGLADCIALKKGQDRIDCFVIELKDIITNMLDNDKVDAFFSYYDQDGSKMITRAELEVRDVTGEVADNFLNELGMGDKEVNFHEFWWFVRQQQLSRMFLTCGKTPGELHPILLRYLADVMTEYDIQQLFIALDSDGNWELESKDFVSPGEEVRHLLKRMDSKNTENSKVNYYEFWLYLNTPIGNPKKEQLEEACTIPQKTQQAEMECYKKEIVRVS